MWFKKSQEIVSENADVLKSGTCDSQLCQLSGLSTWHA